MYFSLIPCNLKDLWIFLNLKKKYRYILFIFSNQSSILSKINFYIKKCIAHFQLIFNYPFYSYTIKSHGTFNNTKIQNDKVTNFPIIFEKDE